MTHYPDFFKVSCSVSTIITDSNKPNETTQITVSSEPNEIMDINYFVKTLNTPKIKTAKDLYDYLHKEMGCNCYIEKGVLYFKTEEDANKAVTALHLLY